MDMLDIQLLGRGKGSIGVCSYLNLKSQGKSTHGFCRGEVKFGVACVGRKGKDQPFLVCWDLCDTPNAEYTHTHSGPRYEINIDLQSCSLILSLYGYLLEISRLGIFSIGKCMVKVTV